MAFASPLGWTWVLAPLIVVALGVFVVLHGIWHFAFGRIRRGTAHVAAGIPLALIGLVIGLVILNTQTFARLSYEHPVAEVQVAALDPRKGLYQVTVRRLDGTNLATSCMIRGDEWEVSARVQKWKPWANVLGLNATYTLDQIGNKYFTAARGNGNTITAYDLTAPSPAVNRLVPPGLLDWLIAHSYAEERHFGSAIYMPMADGAIYRVTMTQAGLNTEAVNPIAQQAVRREL